MEHIQLSLKIIKIKKETVNPIINLKKIIQNIKKKLTNNKLILVYNHNLRMKDINKQVLLGQGRQAYEDLSIVYGVSL